MISHKLVYFVLAAAVRLINFFCKKRSDRRTTLLIIEAGSVGWQHIDYQEQLQSAREYLGEEKVVDSVIDKSQNYLRQVHATIRQHKPTHYFYDCRSGSDMPLKGLLEAAAIACLLIRNDVVPICHLTDLPYIPWRRQINLISANRGVVTTLMSPKQVRNVLTCKNVIGPIPMAVSLQTFNKVQDLGSNKKVNDVITLGSMYEPRKSFVNAIASDLDQLGWKLKRYGRDIGSERLPDDQYWQVMAEARCILTTGFQMHGPLTDDLSETPHLIYRYIEALIAGGVLVADSPPSIERILIPDRHFLKIDDSESAAVKIDALLNNKLVIDASQRIKSIVDLNLFWLLVDYGLQEDSLK